ncbi:aminotransferase class IV family protein [Pigmentiphaga soli]|uniref:Aminotransferase class IV family protein n=1 Tax=Pigmentiphaga soli TaxID=1007095 RepID=A0ABP8GSA6_9BURK
MRPRLIETVRVAADGGMPLLPWHVERLARSCAALGYRWPAERVQRAVARAAAGLPEGQAHRLRLELADDGAVDIGHAVLPPLPERPRVALAPGRLDSRQPLLRHKTTFRPWYAEAAAWLDAHPDHFDLIYLNERGECCEGSRSNLYLRLDGRWYTPPLECGALPGVQRAALLDDEAVEERVLTAADLQAADAVRLSNALRGWFDVKLHEASPIA